MAMVGWNGIMKGWREKLIQLLRTREAKVLQPLELSSEFIEDQEGIIGLKSSQSRREAKSL